MARERVDGYLIHTHTGTHTHAHTHTHTHTGGCVWGGREQSAYAVTKHTQKDKQIMIHNVYVYLVMADTVSKAVPYVMIYNCLSYIMIYNVLYYDI